MKLYYIKDRYIEYLRQFFPRVYSNKEGHRIHSRKYLGTVINIGEIKYYIPLSSPKAKHDYVEKDGIKTIRKDSLIVIRIISNSGNNPQLKATLQIGTMIPVPDDALELYDIDNETDAKYKNLVLEEMIFIRKHQSKIKNYAIRLYKMRYLRNHIPMVAGCLDFHAIEEKYKEWHEINGNN